MPLLKDDTAVRRFARAIASDIAMYRSEKLRPGVDLNVAFKEELDEARTLFQSRVVPELHFLFDQEALPLLVATANGTPIPASAPGPATTPATPVLSRDSFIPGRAERITLEDAKPPRLLGAVALLVVVIVAVAALVLVR